MKTTGEFLAYLCSLDIKLWVDNERLRCSAPKNALTLDIRTELAERKEEILVFIRNNNVAPNLTTQLIRPVQREGNLPLSFAQQRLWFIDQLEPANSLYNLPTALYLKGSLNVTALSQTLNEIVQRHEALRTSFATVEEQAVQVMSPTLTLPLPIVNLQDLPESRREVEVLRLVIGEAQRPFNLAYSPLLRATLLHLSEVEYVIMFTMHHIVSDGWSMGILIQEVGVLYEAFCKGQLSPLPELPIQYADFAVWQRQWLQGQVLEAQLVYWQKQLGSSLSVLQLPTDRPRPKIQTFRGATKSFSLSTNLTEALKALSRNEDVTLFMTLLAAFKTLLHRYTGQDDILVGSPIANRNRNEIETLIGFFVNTLVLRTDLSGNPSFCELLRRVRECTLSAYAHQDLPFEYLIEDLQPERNLSYNPLFQVMFILQNASTEELKLPGLTLSPLKIETKTAKFDLSLSMEDTESGLTGVFEYSIDLFDSVTISRMVDHFITLLSSIVANPDHRLFNLPLLTETERQQLLVDWNDTQAEYPQEQCIHQLFEAQVEQSPDAIAVVFEDQQLTYRELNQRANQLAHYLRSLGVGPEILVGICVERSLDMTIGLLGILKAGGAYVPLDPTYPSERLTFILEDAQVPVLLTQERLMKGIPQHQAEVVCLDTNWQDIDQESQENLLCEVTTDNLAYVIYTSGSTGRPKGVMIKHHSTIAMLDWAKKIFAAEALLGVLASTSICFDLSVFEIFVPLNCGGKVILVENALDLPTLRAAKNVTLINTVPSVIAELLRADGILTSVHTINIAGEPLQNKLVQQLYQWDNIQQVFNLYGPSEDTTYSTFAWIQKGTTNIPPIGCPINNTQVYLLDQKLQLVPVGVPGELYIGGEGLARGYLNRPELTAEKFIPNPFSDKSATCLYKTGDLARYLPNGEIEYLGRIDHQVKVRGFRIELSEIEAHLSQYPKVRETVVVVRSDETSSQRIVAYVVPQSQQTLTITELRDFLELKLPNYMMPAAFVMLEALPLTPNGKVDRKALPAPEVTQLLSESDFIAPLTPTEEMLALIWAEVLGIEKVGIHNNFFTLGGHSLLATRVISQVRQVFQLDLPIRHLFEQPTIAGLAKDIEKATKAGLGLEAPKIERISRSKNLPLSFAQQRLWFLAQLEPNSPFYNIPAAVRLQGQLNLEALQQSFNEILRRHEALRTNFQTIEGQPVAVISPATPLPLPLLDISELPSSQQQGEVRQLTYFEAQQPFNLNSDFLLRVKLLRLGEQEHIVLLTMHHIASDGWSTGIVVDELVAFYQAFCDQQPSPLAELPIQYVDFAAWQRQWLQAEVLQSHISYWCKQLEGAPSILKLPTDYVRPAIMTFAGATYSFELSQELSIAINKLSQQQGTTLFMTLLAAFQTLLWRYTGQEDIVVGSPIANRNQAQIEELIGFFVNTLVLRTNLGGNPTFRELLTRVREMALGAYAHQDLPFEQLVEKLQPQRDLSHTPLFQVMFVLQNVPMSVLELPGLTLSPLESDSGGAKFDLTLYITETVQGLVGSFEYNTDLFEQSTVSRMAGHLQTLLEGIVANPQQRLLEFPLLTELEQQTLLVEWNDSSVEYPQQQCIHQLFEAQVERTPDAVAVVFEDNQLTYCELNARANKLAHYLRSLGVKTEVLVGICVERSLSMIIGLLGILKAGGAYVPLDPTYPQERLAFILEDAQVPVLLSQQRLVEVMPQHKAKIICLDTDWQTIAQQSQENLFRKVAINSLAYLIYTSGSTGKPKGVQIPHSALSNFLQTMRQTPGLNEQDTLLAVTTYSFDIAALELFVPIIVGASLVVVSREVASDGTRLKAKLTDSNATVMQATPATWQLLLAAGWGENHQLKILCGGEALSAQLANQLLKRCDSLWNMYGPTETTIWSAAYQVEKDTSIVPISQPIANTQFYILDQHAQLVPVGVPGELHIGGDGLARGYLNRPELSAEKFIPNPFSDKSAARLYKTGDLARYLPNGEIEYLGRIDYQVKVRGFRIELGEIEAHLSQHPKVRETVVVVRSDEASSQRIVAYVVPQKEQALTITQLRDFLESKLPNYMVPTAFVMLEALPLTPNGKIHRKALPAPDQTRPELEAIYQPPQTEVEKTITKIWQEVLHVEELGIHDNFFELGGHSLLLVQVHSKLQKIFQQDFPLVEMFQYPTINHLARYLSHKSGEQESFRQHSHRPESRTTSVERRKQARKEHRAAQKGVSSQ
ncbi:amino acid adenylation domain-containing protein (plasmid) [Nostoc sp. UHCC 0926]|uniref:non-ribosomal peptide synthetase n=1 Tax=Nostoc sp. UHCC 0926 TaxID=3025190 RepID=UPI00236124E0|nr:non-ribosomal peptide synthetase [Nostoc sp. UHCC 0926]WDD36956.1 amino acid adenylation domain-containing protein [Nostoc sp. UHCC 0926]